MFREISRDMHKLVFDLENEKFGIIKFYHVIVKKSHFIDFRPTKNYCKS